MPAKSADWYGAPLWKQAVVVVVFLTAFLVLDGSSGTSEAWEQAPSLYLPVGLSFALLLSGGLRYTPLVFASSLIAAMVNYHRALFSWCGIPGAIGAYLAYVGVAALLRRRWHIDPKLGTLRDVERFVLTVLVAAVPSALVGILTLSGDGLLNRPDVLKSLVNWWESDSISIVSFTPFLLVYVAPRVGTWMNVNVPATTGVNHRGPLSSLEIPETAGQAASILGAIWLVFFFTPAISYQPLYILFIPVIWIALRHGLAGATLATFAINIGMMCGAQVTHAEGTGLPRLQLAMLALGLTGLCVGAVVSERKRAEESRERLAALVESSNDAIICKTLEGDITAWNSGAEKLFGYSSTEAVGQPIQMLLPPECANEEADILERIACGKRVDHFESVRVRKDGRRVDISATISPVKDSRGAIVGVSKIARDITERKRTEAELQRAKEVAETADRAKSEFLANMSHEIRTPMNGIIGMTELALDTQLTTEQREYLEVVKSSADSLLLLINDILDFSKIEAGKLELDPIEFNLRDSIGDMAKTLALRACEKNLELAVDIQPDVPDFLFGDPSRLRQILVNLLGNAIKFTQRGEVVLRIEAESITTEATSLHLSVRDTGIGIPKDRQQLIFAAFTQADSSTTRQYGGTGLGLTITARLIELMGGSIWVESDIGKGSTFHITASFGLTKNPVKALSTPSILRDLSVLVVDNNATNRRILREMLVGWHMAPTLVEGGPEALAALQKARASGNGFSLVLTDRQMPGMDGFALVERIQSDPQLAGATIIVLTSAGQRGDAARCRQLGIAGYLTKPIKQSELREAILASLNEKPRGREQAPLVTRHSLREARRVLRVLVAEDNLVNQTLVVRLLEKRGHSAVIANNGCEVLAILEKAAFAGFDLVLMDIQMPEMDGLETSAAIRLKEKSSGKHLPIIALTAHAMKGDEARCIAAGVDGYVAKPIQPDELFAAIERVLSSNPKASSPHTELAPLCAQSKFDREAVLAGFNGDSELMKEIVGIFLTDCPKRMDEICLSLTQGDSDALNRAAHSLKGAVSNFSVPAAYNAALKLENMGREQDLTHAEEAFQDLKTEVESLMLSLHDVANTN